MLVENNFEFKQTYQKRNVSFFSPTVAGEISLPLAGGIFDDQ